MLGSAQIRPSWPLPIGVAWGMGRCGSGEEGARGLARVGDRHAGGGTVLRSVDTA